MKISNVTLTLLTILAMVFVVSSSSCKRKGCMKDVPCVDNFDAKAKKEGDCLGCNTFGAYNYCPEATENNGSCFFIRELYSDVSEAGWIDVWVADSMNNSNTNNLSYEGRISAFPSMIPECESSDSSLTVLRQPGEYYYEVETQTGQLEWGWVIFREEGCRLLDVY